MAALRILVIACLLVLGGCSYAYEIDAVMIDGRLAFQPKPEMWSVAKCVSRVEVMSVGRERPVAGQARPLRARNTHAWVDHGGHNCDDHFPVFYGEGLKGVGEGGVLGLEIAPKILEVGVIYEVRITAGATGYGRGLFRLSPDGTVENLSLPAPRS